MSKITWRKLTSTLTDLSEDEVADLLRIEMAGPKRPVIVRRLHQRLSILRSARERAELMSEIGR